MFSLQVGKFRMILRPGVSSLTFGNGCGVRLVKDHPKSQRPSAGLPTKRSSNADNNFRVDSGLSRLQVVYLSRQLVPADR